MTKISERLVALRGKENQAAIARVAGCSPATYSNWENAVNSPPADAIAKLAKHWNVTADYLCGVVDHREPLPPGMWVVDLDYVEALERMDGSHQALGDQGAFAVPQRPQIMSSVEYQKLARRLGPLIERQKGRK